MDKPVVNFIPVTNGNCIFVSLLKMGFVLRN